MPEEQNVNAPLDKDIEENKQVAAMSYLWILFLIPMLTKQKSKFAQFHAKQGLVLFLASLLTVIPFFGWILSLVLIVVSIMGLMKAYNGEWWKMPFVYDLSKKIKL